MGPTPDLNVLQVASGGTLVRGPATQGASSTVFLELKNVGGAPLTIGTIVVAGTDPYILPAFDPSGATLAADEIRVLMFQNRNGATVSEDATVIIPSNDPSGDYSFTVTCPTLPFVGIDGDPAVPLPVITQPAADQRLFVRTRVSRADGRLAIPYKHVVNNVPLIEFIDLHHIGGYPRFRPGSPFPRLSCQLFGDYSAALQGDPAAWWVNDRDNNPGTLYYYRGTSIQDVNYSAPYTYFSVRMALTDVPAPEPSIGGLAIMHYIPTALGAALRHAGYRPLSPRVLYASVE